MNARPTEWEERGGQPGSPRRRRAPRADMESAPTNGGEARSNRETAVTAAMANPCRGPIQYRPGLRRHGVPREGRAPPLQTMANAQPNGMAPTIRATVGRDALIPPDPAAAHGPAERSRPFPTNGAGRAANRENHGPYSTTNLCRGRCLHRPGDPAASRTSAGRINPAPTNKFYVSGQPDGGGICAGS